MLREFVAPAREQLAFSDCPTQPLAPDQVRVRSLFGAAKHGTEMAMYKGYAAPRGGYDGDYRLFTQQTETVRYPVRLGTMCVGDIVETGSELESLRIGDRVVGHGCFRQEHVWAEQTVRKLPDGMPWQAAVCLDPADFALGAVRDGHVRIGDAVAVFGMGAIGLMAVQLARLAGSPSRHHRGADSTAAKGGHGVRRRPRPRPDRVRCGPGDQGGHAPAGS